MKYGNGANVLKDINLKVEAGEFVFILGSSGAGKSSLLKLIRFEESATEGVVTVAGQRLDELHPSELPYFRRGMGVVFQDFRLIPSMTVYDNVAFALRCINMPKRDIRRRVPYILGLVGLSHKARSYPEEISGGEQQRVSLARALVNNPPILIADEPTGNIDPALAYEVIELLKAINESGTTIVIVTHQHELVSMFGGRVVTIEDGVIISDKIKKASGQL